jgi:hypothetical protein
MKNLLIVFILITSVYVGWNQISRTNEYAGYTDQSNDPLFSTFDVHNSGEQVEGEGIVIRILADDNEGSRHQRFILKIPSGQTLLIAHNIDLAPRISFLKEGDSVEFNGVYEWNSKGGVVHWTHHDPGGRHVAGWVKHNGKTYQ